MSVEVTGVKELKRKLLMLGDRMNSAIDGGVYVTAQDVRSSAIDSIQTSSPGRMVTRYTQGGKPYAHTAAGAGQAPNTDTGKLVSSISSEKIKSGEHEVGTNLDYGSYLEVGTVTMSPRPWLYPALNENKGNLIKNIEKVVNIELQRASK